MYYKTYKIFTRCLEEAKGGGKGRVPGQMSDRVQVGDVLVDFRDHHLNLLSISLTFPAILPEILLLVVQALSYIRMGVGISFMTTGCRSAIILRSSNCMGSVYLRLYLYRG